MPKSKAVPLGAALLLTSFPHVAASIEIDSVVVTAKRRPDDLFTQPGNTARLDRSTIEQLSIDHVSEALNRLPGVNIQRGSGQEHLTSIRSPVLTGGAGAGSFLYLQDGVPLRAPGFANVNGLFEAPTELAGAVEVVRGPGSALFGSNAVHGLVNVVSRPPPDTPATRLTLSGGQFGRISATAWTGAEAGPNGYSAGLFGRHDNGWRESSGLYEAKGVMRWEHDGGSGWSGGLNVAFHHLDQDTAGFVQGPDAYKEGELSRGNAFPDAFRRSSSVRLSGQFDGPVSDKVTASITPYGRWTDMTLLMHFLPSQAIEETGHVSAGVLSNVSWQISESLEVIGGLDFEATQGRLSEVQDLPTFGSFTEGVHYDYTVGARVLAAYAQGTWSVSTATRVDAGVRVEHTRYGYDTDVAAGTVGRFIRPADTVDRFTTVTPNLGLSHKINDSIVAYARYARGARAPQATDLYRLQINQTGDGASEETLDSFEAGARYDHAIFQTELVGFAGFKRNYFFRDADGFNVTNGKTRHIGLEWAVTAQPIESLSLSWTGTYARHTYRFDRIVGNASEVITSGFDVDTAPRWQGQASFQWTPVEGFSVGGDWIWMGRYFLNAANTRTYPGHHMFNLRLGADLSETASVFLIMRNLTNTDYAERADFAFGNERYFPGEDRAVSGGLRLAF